MRTQLPRKPTFHQSAPSLVQITLQFIVLHIACVKFSSTKPLTSVVTYLRTLLKCCLETHGAQLVFLKTINWNGDAVSTLHGNKLGVGLSPLLVLKYEKVCRKEKK